MRVDYSWQDASNGYSTLAIAGRDHPRLGGGTERYPALVRSRLAASRPAADDAGDVLEVEGLKTRRVEVPAGQRLWLKAHDSQMPLIIEWC